MPIATTSAATRPFAVAAAKICDSKKASDIFVLDVRKLTTISDWFVVCSVTNELQARAIADELRVSMRDEQGLRELGVEGIQEGRWILQDFGAVVVHIFHESQRGFYDIEGLWADAPRLKWAPAKKKAKKA